MEQYSQIADQYEAAFAAFQRTYALRNPPPPPAKKVRASRGTVVVLAVLLLASVIVSGSRTIPEFAGYLPGGWGIVVGIAAFVMLDIGMVSYAYTRTRNHYSEERHKAINKQLNTAKYLALTIMIAANLHFILKPYFSSAITPGEVVTDQTLVAVLTIISGVVNLIINILVAISAPVLAYMSGDILAQQSVMSERDQRRADAEYEARFQEWMDGLNKSWLPQQKKWGVDINLSTPPALSMSNPVQLDNGQRTDDGQARPSGHGFVRTSDAKQRVITYFEANPEDLTDMDKTARALADTIGVGKSTVASVRSKLLSTSNGHNKEEIE